MNNSISQSEFLNKSRNTILSDSGSIMISQLKTKIFELEQNEKSYDQLYSKYKAIQLENNQLIEKSIQLEYQLRQKTDSLSITISEVKAQNSSLIEELNQKKITNKTLYNANAVLSKSIAEMNSEMESMTQMIQEKEQKNNEMENIVNGSHQQSQKMNEEIRELRNEISALTKAIKAKDDLMKAKEEASVTAEKKEAKSNEVMQRIKEEINIANSTLTKEAKAKKDCEREIDSLKMKLGESSSEVNQLRNLNEELNISFHKICHEKDKLINDIEKYKSHIMILTKANKEYTDEFNEVIFIEEQLNTLLKRDDNLSSSLYSNKPNNTSNDTYNSKQSIGKYYAQTSPIQSGKEHQF